VQRWRDILKAWRRRRKRAAKRMRAFREADVVVVSYGKSGRTWLAAMLSHLYHRRYGLPEDLLLDGDRMHERDPRVPRILFTHDGPGEPWNRNRAAALRTLARKKVVFLARDPRDVAVSLYHHTAKRAEPEVRAREGFAPGIPPPALYDYVAQPDGGKLRGIVGYLNAWAEILPRLPRTLRVSYEGMRADPHGVLARVAAFIDGPFADEEVAAAVAFAAFDSLQAKERAGFFPNFRLQPGDVRDPQSFKVRRGKVGGYRDDFTPEQVAALDALVAAELDPCFGYGARPSPSEPRRDRAPADRELVVAGERDAPAARPGARGVGPGDTG
jgi:alcohol sulfotransferase